MVKLPAPFSEIPYYRLSYSHPSPIHALPKLTTLLNSSSTSSSTASSASSPSVQLWAKREDQAGPLACYGNKYRKFEYLVPDILAQQPNVTTLVSEGGLQSNHTVQVAGLARHLGLECLILLHKGIGGWRAAKDPATYASTGNVQANALLGVECRMTDENDTGGAEGPLLPVIEELKEKGKVPYWISSGASLHSLGGLGYARCAFEIEQQEQEMAANGLLQGTGRFDYIFVACGSGSTFAGLVAGFKLLDKVRPTGSGAGSGSGSGPDSHRRSSRQIIGVMTSPTKTKQYHEERILRIARTAAKLIGLDPEQDILPEDIRLDDRFAGTAYGVLDPDTKKTLETVSSVESIFLDPVYTAKVMRGMMAWIERGEMQSDSLKSFKSLSGGNETPLPSPLNALFIHTGGQSALSAYADVT